jgi:hypothetical protein
MGASAKTDNDNLASKLALRRHFLARYHAGTRPSVIDCCQGDGVTWKTLRKEFACAYFGADVKPKKGRLKIDSSRILAQPGWSYDVIDVDTYGTPWAHWDGILRHLRGSTTVFLTSGRVIIGGGSPASRQELDALGITFDVPAAFGAPIASLAVDYLLANVLTHGITVVEAVESTAGRHARYFGLRLERPTA